MVTSVALYLAFLALVGAERLAELALSARHVRRLKAAQARESGREHFPAMAALHALFLPACAAEVLLLHRPFPGALGLAALVGALLAQGLRYWAIASLGERWCVRVVVPPDRPPVTSGPYRFLRHPNYLAVALEIACVPLVHGAWLCAIAFSLANAAILARRIRVEEAALGPLWEAAFKGRRGLAPRSRG